MLLMISQKTAKCSYGTGLLKLVLKVLHMLCRILHLTFLNKFDFTTFLFILEDAGSRS